MDQIDENLETTQLNVAGGTTSLGHVSAEPHGTQGQGKGVGERGRGQGKGAGERGRGKG